MQTLIAIGALAITITFALSTQRAEIKTDRQKILAETQILAGQIATDVLTHISIQEFDANTKDGTVDSPNGLTPTSMWPGGKSFHACTDVDDFHDMQTYTVAAGPGLDFDVDAQVRYVGTDGSPSTTRTFQKEVIVTVRDTPRTVNGQTTYTLPVPLELRQIVAMK